MSANGIPKGNEMDPKLYLPIVTEEYLGHYKIERQAAPIGLRAEMAWQLIAHFGAVAGKESTEHGEKIILQSPEELIERCFKIVGLYLEKVEQLGELIVFAEAAQKSRDK